MYGSHEYWYTHSYGRNMQMLEKILKRNEKAHLCCFVITLHNTNAPNQLKLLTIRGRKKSTTSKRLWYCGLDNPRTVSCFHRYIKMCLLTVWTMRCQTGCLLCTTFPSPNLFERLRVIKSKLGDLKGLRWAVNQNNVRNQCLFHPTVNAPWNIAYSNISAHNMK